MIFVTLIGFCKYTYILVRKALDMCHWFVYFVIFITLCRMHELKFEL